MKTEWICRWQYVPGHDKHIETYSTLGAARQAMAKVLTDAVDLRDYLQASHHQKTSMALRSAKNLTRAIQPASIIMQAYNFRCLRSCSTP